MLTLVVGYDELVLGVVGVSHSIGHCIEHLDAADA